MSWHRDREDSATEADRERTGKRPRSAQSPLGTAPDLSLAPASNRALTRLLQPGRLPASPSALAPAGNAAVARLMRTTTVQRAALPAQDAGPLHPEIATAIDAERGGGAALPDGIRAEMEGHLGVDLSPVRLHTGPRADTLNRAVNAQAFTTGTDVFFSSGKYDPSSSSGRELLAHELTHVAQQASGTADVGARVSHPADASEVEARDVAQRVMRSTPGPEPVREPGPGTIARRPATGLVAREPGDEPTPGQQTALVLAAQNIIDVVAHDLKTSVSGQETGAKILVGILMNTVASVTAAGLIARLPIEGLPATAAAAVSATLNKAASESIVGMVSKIGNDKVDLNSFVDTWVAEQKWGFAVRLHEIWRQQGGNPTELEQSLAKIPTAGLTGIRYRLYRGVLAAFMESAQRTKGFWDPGGLGLLHVQLPLGGGKVSCRFIGYSGDIEKANQAFERTGVDPLQIGEHGVPVVLTVERPDADRNIVDDVLSVASLGSHRRGYRYENYWLRPVGVTISPGGSLKGGMLAMHKYGQLSNIPANWEAPEVAIDTASMSSFEVDGPMRDALQWTHYGMKFPIPAAFGESGPIGWYTVQR